MKLVIPLTILSAMPKKNFVGVSIKKWSLMFQHDRQQNISNGIWRQNISSALKGNLQWNIVDGVYVG
jgi:hypothetical protein